MGVLSTPVYGETLTVTDILCPSHPQNLSDNPAVKSILDDFSKLHFPKRNSPSITYSPDDPLNYNDGKEANPFNKLAVNYGRHKDVFLFVSVVFSPEHQEKFLSTIHEKCEGDKDSMSEFMRKMKTYMKRISKGTEDATDFLPEEMKHCNAFFNGYHVAAGERKRNIHENLNLNVTNSGESLKLTELFARDIPAKEGDSSELRRLKIYTNGQRAMTVYKEDGGQRTYTPTKAANMDLEVVWKAKLESGEEVKCKLTLGFENGRANVKKAEVEGEDGLLKDDLDIVELAKQNDGVRIRNKSLFELLRQKKERQAAKAEQKSKKEKDAQSAESAPIKVIWENSSHEKLTPLSLPPPVETMQSKLDSFSQLNFSVDVITDPSDVYNFNEGKAANPFDKLAKVQGRRKDVFLFNQLLRSPEQFGKTMSIINKNCEDDKKKHEFLKRKDIYLQRISQGELDALDIIGQDLGLEAFTHGYHVEHPGHPRNIHSNLNINFKSTMVKPLDISEYFTKVTPRVLQEKSEVNRVKLYGHGRRLANVIKNGAERNYNFSYMANLNFEIDWVAKNESGKEVKCSLLFAVKSGEIFVEGGALDGIPVECMKDLLEMAKQNRQVLIRNKSLYTVLMETLQLGEADTKIADNSREMVTILNSGGSDDKENAPLQPALDSLLKDVASLDFSSELCTNPSDRLNYNNGLEANQFDKLRKYWGRRKNLLEFISILEDPPSRAQVFQLVETKCEGNVKMMDKFKKRMGIFLKRMEAAREDAKQFLEPWLEGEEVEAAAMFGGYHVEQNGHARNIHGNLILDAEKTVGVPIPTSYYFSRKTPRMVEEKSLLNRIKLFMKQGRVMTITNAKGQRNYICGSDGRMELQIEWNFEEKKCEVLLGIEKGRVRVICGKVNGDLVGLQEMMEVAKGNEEVLIRNKSLQLVLQEAKESSPPDLCDIPIGSDDEPFVLVGSDGDTGAVMVDDEKSTSSDDMMGDW